MNDLEYRACVRRLSDRLVEAQRGIRILDAVAWNDAVREDFFSRGCKEQPRVTAEYYRDRPLGFVPDAVTQELKSIQAEIESTIGVDDPAARLMLRMSREYRGVIRMLEARGTAQFSAQSVELFGSACDRFHNEGPSLADLAVVLDDALHLIHQSMFFEREIPNIPTADAVTRLQADLDRVFCEPDNRVRVVASDGIIADAAAGSDYIKLRQNAAFTARDLRVLEVHEGWVHVGTTLNGREQEHCTFLSKGTPSTTITQEGLAFFAEIVSFSSHPARLRRVTDRIRGIDMAQQGATFLDVFRHFVDGGREAEDAYKTTIRIFRGSTPEGGPFTKDLAYSRGFILVYNFIRLAVRRGLLDRIAWLFCGKLSVFDMGSIAALVERGLVTPPRHVPPFIADLSALTAWMAYSVFLNQLDLKQVEADFDAILS